MKGDSKFYISLAHAPEDIAFTPEAFQGALTSTTPRAGGWESAGCG